MDEPKYPTSAAVARNIKGLMGKNDCNQTELADHLGMSQPALSRRLRGKQEWSIDELDTVAERFDVSIPDLLVDLGIFKIPCFGNPGELLEPLAA